MGFLIVLFIVFNLYYWVGVAVLTHLEENSLLPVGCGMREHVKNTILWPLTYNKYKW